MAKSDIDDCCDSPGLQDKKMVGEVDENVLDKSNDTTIHSGHFMVSCVHDENDDGEAREDPTKSPDVKKGFDFIDAAKETVKIYQFGPRVHHWDIDASLTTLFDCMTLAYSGKLTSPKWKNFKGIKLRLKDKIRLNNIIWREWHMQYIQGQKPIVCQFDPPIADRTHTKPEAVVLEGKYWKRRLESVTAEYKKWRLFFKERFGKHPEEHKIMEELASHAELLERVGQRENLRFTTQAPMPASFAEQLMEDDFSMDFSDTLFTTLNQPFAFPNPKELSQLGNADIIQPGLIQLQPSLDDFMDTLEPLPSLQGRNGPVPVPNHQAPSSRRVNPLGSISEMLVGNRLSGFSSFSGLSNNNFASMPSSQTMNDIINTNVGLGDAMSLDLLGQGPQSGIDLQSTTPQPTAMDSSNQSQISSLLDSPPVMGMPGPTAAAIGSDPASQIISLVLNSDYQQPGQASQTITPGGLITNKPAAPIVPSVVSLATTMASAPNTVTIIQNGSQLQTLLQSLSNNTIQAPTVQYTANNTIQQQQQRQQQQVLPTSPPLLNQTGLVNPSIDIQKHQVVNKNKTALVTNEANRRASTGSIGNKSKAAMSKKQGDFLVPQTTTIPRSSKQRTIAPTPPSGSPGGTPPKSSILQQSTFLAQLLTTGTDRTYPGAIKQETTKPCMSTSFQPIRPAATTSTVATATGSSQAFALGSSNGVTEMQKNMLLAAASQALGTTANKISEAMAAARPACKAGESPVSPVLAYSGPNSPESPHFQVPSPGFDPVSPAKPVRHKLDTERQQYKEHRRVSHISAEQKRRCNIKCDVLQVGFDTLHQLVPALSQNPNKISKAATLQKTAEFCRKLKSERSQMQEEAEILRQEIEALNSDISVCQSQLPATGVPVTRQRVDQMRDMFDEYVRNRTLQNWKFWIFSIIIRCLFDTYNNMVSTASIDELCRSVLSWLEQHCSLVALRPAVLNSLRQLSTTTSILSDPSRVPEQATQAVTRRMSEPSSSTS